MGYSPWGCKELDTTEQLQIHINKMDGILINFCLISSEGFQDLKKKIVHKYHTQGIYIKHLL